MRTYEEIKAESDKQLQTYQSMYEDFYRQRDRAFAARLEERKQHEEKKMALAANAKRLLALGMIRVVVEKSANGMFIGDTIEKTYAWLDYCSSLPHQMFNDSEAGDRIKKNFDTLWDLYRSEENDQPFTHWLDDVEPTWLDVPDTWPTNSTNEKS